MKYATIKKVDSSNGIGIRVSLYVSGCRNHCPGCFNPETWDFGYGEEFTEEIQNRIINLLKPHYVRGLSLLGGDPFEPENCKALIPFVKKVKEIYPNKDVWCWTGYLYENLLKDANFIELLSYIDILVDGRFILEKKNIKLQFRGSSNQRIIDLKKSTIKNIVLWEDPIEIFRVDNNEYVSFANKNFIPLSELNNVKIFERDELAPPKIGMGCGRDC